MLHGFDWRSAEKYFQKNVLNGIHYNVVFCTQTFAVGIHIVYETFIEEGECLIVPFFEFLEILRFIV